jgi:hypothetical protein
MQREPLTSAQHLTEGATLAVPPAGELSSRHLPNALVQPCPVGVEDSGCVDLAERDRRVASRRTPRGSGEALEDRTLAAIRGRAWAGPSAGWWAAAVAGGLCSSRRRVARFAHEEPAHTRPDAGSAIPTQDPGDLRRCATWLGVACGRETGRSEPPAPTGQASRRGGRL